METRSVVHDGVRHGVRPVPPGRNPPNRQNLIVRVAALEARVAELTAEVQARDEFIAVAAHELRNPMVPVSGQVELLLKLARRLPVGAEFVAGLERLDRAIGTLLKRAVAVLNVSRISSGQFRPEFADVDLSDLVQQSVAALSALADRAGSR